MSHQRLVTNGWAPVVGHQQLVPALLLWQGQSLNCLQLLLLLHMRLHAQTSPLPDTIVSSVTMTSASRCKPVAATLLLVLRHTCTATPLRPRFLPTSTQPCAGHPTNQLVGWVGW
jgi:hypothetical protein